MSSCTSRSCDNVTHVETANSHSRYTSSTRFLKLEYKTNFAKSYWYWYAHWAVNGPTCIGCTAGMYQPDYTNRDCVSCPKYSYSPPRSNALTDCICNPGTIGPHGGPCTCSPGFGIPIARVQCTGRCGCNTLLEGSPSGTLSSSKSDLIQNWVCTWTVAAENENNTISVYFEDKGLYPWNWLTLHSCTTASCTTVTKTELVHNANTIYTTSTPYLKVVLVEIISQYAGFGITAVWNVNAPSCEKCAAGKYASAKYDSECIICPVNSGSTAGSSTCVCNAGWETGSEGECTQCAVGKYKASMGSHECNHCGTNMYLGSTGSSNVSDCTACGIGKYSAITALESADGCQPLCGDGIYIFPSELCDDGNTDSGDGCNGTCGIENGWICTLHTFEGMRCQEVCGNSIRTSNEACDDGNTEDGDGCSHRCSIEFGFNCSVGPPQHGDVCFTTCGDGIMVVDTEVCDDGNTVSHDGCSASCFEVECGFICAGNQPQLCTTVCGDGVLAGDEICDDNNTKNGDGCTSDCVQESGWDCTSTVVACGQSRCSAICGDGMKLGSEMCDDGDNEIAGDGCSATCTIDCGYVCMVDVEGVNSTRSLCVAAACGDGIVAGTEECDDNKTNSAGDNKTNSADGCSDTCVVERGYACAHTLCQSTICVWLTGNEVCGDGITLGSETNTPNFCDDGNLEHGDGCSAVCTVECGFECNDKQDDGYADECVTSCGNGVKTTNQSCDDGNNMDEDGCSSTCTIETGYICAVNAICGPSICVCIAGYESLDGNMCSQCVAGKYKNAVGNEICQTCTLNSYSSIGSSRCQCDPGYAGTDGSTCTQCAAGKYKVAPGNTDCQVCAVNTNSLLASTTCTCNTGYTGPNNGICTQCVPGKYKSQVGERNCTSCLPGKYSSLAGAISPDTCSLCPMATYSSTHGAIDVSTCTDCHAYSDSPAGSDTVNNCTCDAGIASAYDGTCTPCAAGTYKRYAGTGLCVACPANSDALSGSIACHCNTGFTDIYTATANAIIPSLLNCTCAVGYTGIDGGNCTSCVAGKYKSVVGYTTCIDCAPGTFSNVTGTSSCTSCAAGTYSFPYIVESPQSYPFGIQVNSQTLTSIQSGFGCRLWMTDPLDFQWSSLTLLQEAKEETYPLDWMAFGVRHTNSQTLSIISFIPVSQFVEISGTTSVADGPINGAYWYWLSTSFGFAPSKDIK